MSNAQNSDSSADGKPKGAGEVYTTAEGYQLRQANEKLVKSHKELEKRASDLASANQRLQEEVRLLQQAEVEAARRANELSALHQATTILLSTLDLSTLLGQILDAATNAIPGAEKGMLHLIAPDTGQLEMRATIGYSDARIQKFTFPGSKSYVARTVQGKKPLLINDVQTEPLGRLGMVHPEARTIRSAIAAPLITADKILGALSLESSKRSAFDGSDLHLLKSFAATATLAIQNAQLHAEVQKLAITDSLTGLYNRRGFDSFGNREVERLHRFGRPLSALMVDVDDFKDVNDHYGHHVGDQVIREVGKRISRNLREVDIIGRFGGDEFCILLPEADLVTARGVAERLRSEIEEQPIEIDGVPIFITISVGVARALPNAENLDNILGKADKALYTAKQHGRNRVEIGAG